MAQGCEDRVDGAEEQIYQKGPTEHHHDHYYDDYHDYRHHHCDDYYYHRDYHNVLCEGGEGGHVQVLHNQTGKSDGKGSVSEIDDDQMHEDNKVGDNHDDDRDQYVLLHNFHSFVIL